MIFVFGDCELDLDRFELRRDGRPRPVEPQVFDLLAVLIRERHRVVPKEELLDTVWGDRFVSESALTSRVKAARQAIGDDGRSQRFIRTAHGRGYQFAAPVDEAVQSDPAAAVSPAPPAQEIRFCTTGDIQIPVVVLHECGVVIQTAQPRGVRRAESGRPASSPSASASLRLTCACPCGYDPGNQCGGPVADAVQCY